MPERITFYGHDEAAAFIKQYNLRDVGGILADALAEELRRAYYRGMYHLYVFQPVVRTEFGEMHLVIVTRAKSFFDARRQAESELLAWKRSQESLGRNDFPWLDQALQHIQEATGADYTQADEPTKVGIYWYDDREQ